MTTKDKIKRLEEIIKEFDYRIFDKGFNVRIYERLALSNPRESDKYAVSKINELKEIDILKNNMSFAEDYKNELTKELEYEKSNSRK